MTFGIVKAEFTRPANTIQYTSGDLIANNTTAGDVEPLVFAVSAKLRGTTSFMIRNVQMYKSSGSTTNAIFRINLFSKLTEVTNGDNGNLAVVTNQAYIGSFTLDCTSADSDRFFDYNDGTNAVSLDNTVVGETEKGIIYGLLEARGDYTPTSAELFEIYLGLEV